MVTTICIFITLFFLPFNIQCMEQENSLATPIFSPEFIEIFVNTNRKQGVKSKEVGTYLRNIKLLNKASNDSVDCYVDNMIDQCNHRNLPVKHLFVDLGLQHYINAAEEIKEMIKNDRYSKQADHHEKIKPLFNQYPLLKKYTWDQISKSTGNFTYYGTISFFHIAEKLSTKWLLLELGLEPLNCVGEECYLIGSDDRRTLLGHLCKKYKKKEEEKVFELIKLCMKKSAKVESTFELQDEFEQNAELHKYLNDPTNRLPKNELAEWLDQEYESADAFIVSYKGKRENPNIKTAYNFNRQNPLHVFLYLCNSKTSEELITTAINSMIKDGIDPHAQDSMGNTALHIAVMPDIKYIYETIPCAIEILLAFKPALFLKNAYFGQTPFICLARTKEEKVFNMLIKLIPTITNIPDWEVKRIYNNLTKSKSYNRPEFADQLLITFVNAGIHPTYDYFTSNKTKILDAFDSRKKYTDKNPVNFKKVPAGKFNLLYEFINHNDFELFEWCLKKEANLCTHFDDICRLLDERHMQNQPTEQMQNAFDLLLKDYPYTLDYSQRWAENFELCKRILHRKMVLAHAQDATIDIKKYNRVIELFSQNVYSKTHSEKIEVFFNHIEEYYARTITYDTFLQALPSHIDEQIKNKTISDLIKKEIDDITYAFAKKILKICIETWPKFPLKLCTKKLIAILKKKQIPAALHEIYPQINATQQELFDEGDRWQLSDQLLKLFRDTTEHVICQLKREIIQTPASDHLTAMIDNELKEIIFLKQRWLLRISHDKLFNEYLKDQVTDLTEKRPELVNEIKKAEENSKKHIQEALAQQSTIIYDSFDAACKDLIDKHFKYIEATAEGNYMNLLFSDAKNNPYSVFDSEFFEFEKLDSWEKNVFLQEWYAAEENNKKGTDNANTNLHRQGSGQVSHPPTELNSNLPGANQTNKNNNTGNLGSDSDDEEDNLSQDETDNNQTPPTPSWFASILNLISKPWTGIKSFFSFGWLLSWF